MCVCACACACVCVGVCVGVYTIFVYNITYTFACAYQCVSYYKMKNNIVGWEAFVIKSVFIKKINNYLASWSCSV